MKRSRRSCAPAQPIRSHHAIGMVELLEDRSAPTDLGLTAFQLWPPNPLPAPLPESELRAVAADPSPHSHASTDAEPALPLH